MGLGIKRSRTSCFCSAGCPAGTYPFDQYWVTAKGIGVPDTGGAHWLMRFKSQSMGLACLWEAVDSHGIPPITASIVWEESAAPVGFRKYTVTFSTFQLIIVGTWAASFTSPIETEGLIEPEAPASCSRIKIVLPFAIPTTGNEAILTPAFPNACDDADWPIKEQRKPVAAH